MGRILLWVLPIFIFLIIPMSNSVEDNVRRALVQFLMNLSAGNVPGDENWGWNISSDPCRDKWRGVFCDSGLRNVKRIVLNELNLTGNLDASSVCLVESLNVLSIEGNGIVGFIPIEMGNCKHLTHLYLSGNRFSGVIPDSLSRLSNLKRLDISNNDFSGDLPDLSRISGLFSFVAHDNHICGVIPDFDFSNLQEFNVSNNNFSGPIPDVRGRFGADSFSGNPELCGKPLSNACPPSPPPPSNSDHKHSSKNQYLIYSGYIILALVVLLLIVLKLVCKKKPKEEHVGVVKKRLGSETSTGTSGTSSEVKTGTNRSEYSITSAQSGMTSSALVVLKSPVANGLTFEDLLRAPATLLGRGKHGSLYKVEIGDGVILAVKRMKNCGVSRDDFRRRMQRISQTKHPRVLPPVAFYCSKQEMLLVYDYQPNGSLFKLLHGSQNGKLFDWGSRLQVAAIVSEALAFMHKELFQDGIAHGNLKSTNILLNTNMEPCISEYGLMVIENQDQPLLPQTDGFKADVYGFGVILLELLTGKMAQNSGFDLAKWVHSVVREEWTVEVFDKSLVSEGASEERMVSLLQVALNCIHPSANERPSISQVAATINSIKDEDERSVSPEP